MRNRQTGVSLTGLMIGAVILIFGALLGMKVGPAYAEFSSARSIVRTIAVEKRGASVAEIRKAWTTKTMIDEIKALGADDLEVTKEGGEIVISFAYRKEIPLFANVGVYIDFVGNSKE